MTDDDICAVMGWPATHRTYRGTPGDLMFRLRALVAAAAAQERARVLAWLDTALADSGVCWPGEADIVREQIARGE